MKIPRFYTAAHAGPIGTWRTLMDVSLILALVAAMVAIRAHSPSDTYSYAQFWQINASIDHLNEGSLILPKIDSMGTPARKGQLYAWILTATMKLTGLSGEFVFRAPTILAGAGLALLVYLLGRRWYGRLPGLAGACLWTVGLKMNKICYLATTDMLLAFWICLCIFCVDRLTFHPAGPGRWAWAMGFWASMIFAGLTKSWGIVNVAIVGGFLALASAAGPGVAATRRVAGPGRKALLLARLILRRWWATMRACKLFWGVLAMLAVFVPLGIAMLHIGGEKFRQTLRYEVWNRLTGQGTHAPGSVQGPAIVHLYYSTIPASIFAGCAFFLVPLRRWLSRRGPITLPLAWIIVVLVAFGIPHGFRPDYLLPCYPAVALLAGWAVGELSQARWWDHRLAKHLRRICQAVPFVLACGLIVIPLLYFFHDALPGKIGQSLTMPPRMLRSTWYILAALPGVGLLIVAAGVWAIRRRAMGLTVAAVCLGMLGLLFCNSHLFRRHARTGDGDVMVRFARDVKPVIGSEPATLYCAGKFGLDAYLGRFNNQLPYQASLALAEINAPGSDWLIISDFGLVQLGAADKESVGPYRVKKAGRKHYFRPRPQDIGTVSARSVAPIQFENWGCVYLIKVRRPVKPTGRPFFIGYISDPVK